MRSRLYSLVLAVAFVLGVVAYPAWHRAHCGGAAGAATAVRSVGQDRADTSHRRGHDSEHCPVCHLAHTPLAPVADAPTVALTGVRTGTVAAASDHVPVRPGHVLPFSCGPPARA